MGQPQFLNDNVHHWWIAALFVVDKSTWDVVQRSWAKLENLFLTSCVTRSITSRAFTYSILGRWLLIGRTSYCFGASSRTLVQLRQLEDSLSPFIDAPNADIIESSWASFGVVLNHRPREACSAASWLIIGEMMLVWKFVEQFVS